MESNKIVLDYFIERCETYSGAKGLAESLFYHGNAQEYSSTVDISLEQLYGNYFTIDGALVYEREFNMAKESISSTKKTIRTTYEKVEFEHAWEAVKAWCEGEELFVEDPLASSREYIIAEFSSLRFPQNIYRKVEKEIDWRDEVYNHIREKSGYHWSEQIGEIVNDESDIFLQLARTALRATGELE